MIAAFFIEYLFDPARQLFFGCVVITVIISIVLHELAHGWAAIWQGDDTPRLQGHMTADPMVHMGGMSLLMLVLVGFAFGAMPVNPHNFRSKYGDALVSAAGPAMNFLLALVSLIALGLWLKMGGLAAEGFARSLQPGSGTNIHDSLVLALKVKGVETIYLLSDGAPSRGGGPAEIKKRVSAMNYLLGVRVVTYGFTGSDEKLMKDLAGNNWGWYRALNKAKKKKPPSQRLHHPAYPQLDTYAQQRTHHDNAPHPHQTVGLFRRCRLLLCSRSTFPV